MTDSTSAALRKLRDAGQGDLARRLDRLFAAFATQAVADNRFAEALTDALDDGPLAAAAMLSRRTQSRPSGRSGGGARNVGGRRPAGPFDPYEAYAEGEETLRRRLGDCDLEQLKDMVAEHGMDHDRLAMKWKTPERLVDRIIDTVSARAHKGEAFRGPVPPRTKHQG